MFAGIVETTGTVTFAGERDGSFVLQVQSELLKPKTEAERFQLGDSISISGVCLSAVEIDPEEGTLNFDLATETRRCTILGGLTVGDPVNLERSLLIGERLHGHFVQGHVDTVSEVLERIEDGNTIKFRFHLPDIMKPLVAPKGSVAINGVSLTVGEKDEESFTVYIIPHTCERTTFGTMQVGDRVNLEADMLARYLRELLAGEDVSMQLVG